MLHEGLKAFYLLVRCHQHLTIEMREDALLQIHSEGFAGLLVNQIGRQERNTPGTAFTGRIHNGHRCMAGCRQIALTDALCLEETAMPHDAVDFDAFFFQNVQANLDGAQRGVKMRPHEVGEIEAARRRPQKDGASFIDHRDVLAGVVAVRKQPPAVRVALQRVCIQLVEQVSRAGRNPHKAGKLTKEADPGIEIRRAVIGM